MRKRRLEIKDSRNNIMYRKPVELWPGYSTKERTQPHLDVGKKEKEYDKQGKYKMSRKKRSNNRTHCKRM